MNQGEDNPSNWIWGVFYYNKDDKRLFPPKRLSYLGWTVNFANPYSILCMAGLLAFVAVIINLAKAS